MNIKQLQAALPHLFKIKAVPLIVGHHGEGKTEAIRKVAKDNDWNFFDLRVGNLDSTGDVLGIQYQDPNNPDTFKFTKPDWFPTGEKPMLIFLDELSRGRPDILQSIFQMIYDRRLHTHVFPENTYFAAAMNPDTADYIVTNFSDRAFLDRFCFIKYKPEDDEFLEYFRKISMDDLTQVFLNENPKYLRDATLEDFEVKASPSPRTWDKYINPLREMVQDKEVFKQICFGFLGVEVTSHYMEFLKTQETIVKPLEILENYDGVKSKIKEYTKGKRTGILKVITSTLFDFLVKENPDSAFSGNVEAYLIDIPIEVAFGEVRRRLLDTKPGVEKADWVVKLYDNSPKLKEHFKNAR